MRGEVGKGMSLRRRGSGAGGGGVRKGRGWKGRRGGNRRDYM